MRQHVPHNPQPSLQELQIKWLFADRVMAIQVDPKLERIPKGARPHMLAVLRTVLKEGWPFLDDNLTKAAVDKLREVAVEEVRQALGEEQVPPPAVDLPASVAAIRMKLWLPNDTESHAAARDLLARILFGMREKAPAEDEEVVVHFNARFREIVLSWLTAMGVDRDYLLRWEKTVGVAAFASLPDGTEDREAAKSRNKWKFAACVVGGGVLIGVTGGLAAPAIGAGVIGMGYGLGWAGAAAGATTAGAIVGGTLVGVGLIIAGMGMATTVVIFGASGAGLVGWRMGTKFGLEDFRFVPVAPLVEVDKAEEAAQKQEGDGATRARALTRTESQIASAPKCCAVQCTVCIEGWASDRPEDHDAAAAFRGVERDVFINSDVFAIAWEPSILSRLGKTLVQFEGLGADDIGLVEHNPGMIARSWKGRKREVPQKVDKRWQEAMGVLEEAGKAMAAAITDEDAAGRRPITLVGYSLGAGVIFHALQELHKMEKYHVVQSVYLMGAPSLLQWTAPDGEQQADVSAWKKARAVVSDRFVNLYSNNDWLLGVLMRKMEWSEQVAGLTPINIEGIENVDISDKIRRHTTYSTKVQELLVAAEAFR